jgi:hypothetical protein
MQVEFRTIDGVRVRYAKSTRRADRSILLTSPWPETVYAFAHQYAALIADWVTGVPAQRQNAGQPHTMSPVTDGGNDEFEQ